MQAPSNELLNKVKNGDMDVFGELYKLYRQSCYGFALMILKSHEDAEDAVQNTFIRMHGSIRSLKNDEAFIMWMEKILNRECLRIAQRRGVETTIGDYAKIDHLTETEDDYMLPEVYAERKDLSDRLWQEIERLPFEQRRVLILHYYHGLSLSQIADLTDANLNTVKSRLRYARDGVKTNIEQHEKKSGEKFYGVPMLPFREILTRLLDREKEKKKPAALWRSLQKEIESLNAGFSGAKVSGSGRSLTKTTAGVIAGMIALGAMTGLLSGAVTEDGSGGWGRMLASDPEAPQQVFSTEPGSNIESPVAYRNDNVWTPFNEDVNAPYSLDAPQSSVDNNNETPAVQPTQTVRNTPISPTQASSPKQSSTQPTQSPADTPEQNQTASQAYRSLLQQNEQAIRRYNWQFSSGSYPVATADICGDSTPELLFISASGNTAALSAYTYDGIKTVSLLSSSALRSDAGVNDTFFLFQKSGDKRLYLYSADDNDYGSSRCLRFDESGGGLTATELCASKVYPSKITVGGKEVSSSAFADYERSLFSDISSILMRNDARGMCSDEAYDALERYTSRAMTLDEALSTLED